MTPEEQDRFRREAQAEGYAWAARMYRVDEEAASHRRNVDRRADEAAALELLRRRWQDRPEGDR
ncbi:MAG: hypothetical protein ACHQZR_09070 [Candidatus Limnocylindrales bacterium]